MEWLPGKNAALSAACATDAAIGNLPLVYPFLVNDPGEGAQAKRRAHATIVDHLIPPMARAESYGDIARLEQLLDEHANIAAMDPAKLPAIRGEIWTLMHAAEMHRDLGLEERPDDEEFDDFILHVDGWLCEIKDAQIRDGLHVLGQAPEGEARVNLVLAILRAAQVWGGETASVPGLRAALGLKEGARQARNRGRGRRDRGAGPRAGRADGGGRLGPGRRRRRCTTTRRSTGSCGFAATQVVPRLARTTDELDAVLHALDGGFVPAGPSGSPLRGLVNVLPTGRNFYTVDPRAVPSRLAWETGSAMADSLVQRYLDETGAYPESVGLSVWGTSRDAHVRRRHRRGARAARRTAGVGRGLPPGRRPGGRAARGAGPAPDRRDRADLRLLPRRLPARGGDARRRRPAGRRARRAARPELRARPRPGRPRRARRRSAARPPGSSAPSRGRTAPASCR